MQPGKSYPTALRFRASARAMLLAVLPLLVTPVRAIDTSARFDVGLGYTSNATLVPNNEPEDWIASGSAGLSVAEVSGPLTGGVEATLQHQDYLRNTYGNLDYAGLNAQLRWEQVKNRLSWQLDDFFEQVPVDSLDSNTPTNIQNTNVVSFGPVVMFNVTPRNHVSLKPMIQHFYYQKTDIDNRQLGLAASWRFSLYPTMKTGLDISFFNNL